jgi:EAL domain-containing protein (putative c-di-GMP-specific phosphodiesterase class I)
VLKIDRSFVLRCLHSERDAAIAHTLVDLGRRLSLHVVAEGVENAEVLELLAGWGCDEAQGYYLGRPMSGTDLRTWLDRLPAREGRPSGR